MDVVSLFFVGVLAEGVDGLAAVELAVIDILRRTHNGDVQLTMTGADVVPVDEVDMRELASSTDTSVLSEKETLILSDFSKSSFVVV